MKEVAKYIAIFILIVFGITLFAWGMTGFDLAYVSFWKPKYENVERKVFENTKSYNQGMVQELQNMQFEYEQATPTQKEALKKIILHRAADFPEDKMPRSLRQFIQGLKSESEVTQ